MCSSAKGASEALKILCFPPRARFTPGLGSVWSRTDLQPQKPRSVVASRPALIVDPRDLSASVHFVQVCCLLAFAGECGVVLLLLLEALAPPLAQLSVFQRVTVSARAVTWGQTSHLFSSTK